MYNIHSRGKVSDFRLFTFSIQARPKIIICPTSFLYCIIIKKNSYSQTVQIGQTLLEVLVAEAAYFREDLRLLFDLELQRIDRIVREDLLRQAGHLLAHSVCCDSPSEGYDLRLGFATSEKVL